MAKLRPLGDKILVKRVEAESKTKSGIVLPDSAKEKDRPWAVFCVSGGSSQRAGVPFAQYSAEALVAFSAPSVS